MTLTRRIEAIPYRLPLRRPWRFAGRAFDTRQGWLLAIHVQGCTGYGDCAPLPETGTGSYAECEAWLQRLPAPLQGRSPEDLLADSGLFDSAPPALAHALETALLDLQARLLGEPLHRLLAPHAKRRIPVNAMIGALDEEASERAIAAQQAGFTTIKIKIGMRSPDRTLQQLRALSARLTPGTRLRLDANRAWRSVDDVHRFLHGLADLPVEYVEEPLRTPRLETLQTLQRDTPVPLALDESLGDLSPAAVFDTLPGVCLILKPMCLGGLRPTLALARQARAHGVKTVCTSMVQSAAGIWSTAQLAACLGHGNELPAQGLATSHWLTADLGQPPRIHHGSITLSGEAGSGFVPRDRTFD